MIEQIKQALEIASLVPWKVGTASPNGLQNVGTMRGAMVCQTFTVNDANLIANSPEWLAYLIGEVERLADIATSKQIAFEAAERDVMKLQRELREYRTHKAI